MWNNSAHLCERTTNGNDMEYISPTYLVFVCAKEMEVGVALFEMVSNVIDQSTTEPKKNSQFSFQFIYVIHYIGECVCVCV